MDTARVAVAGRVCPSSYSYSPSIFARPEELSADVLYVVGGLYGNRFALSEVERMAESEEASAQIVFNGDFHWFDASPEQFALIDRAVERHTALRGNVETEIAGDETGNGCGCAYPESVPDGDVERSNAILQRLRETACKVELSDGQVRQRLAELPMHCVARVGDARIGLVHGDAWALAGWSFSHSFLHDGGNLDHLSAVFEQAALDGFACSHTCAPALKAFDTALGERFVINNGAAGMPNFKQTRYGVITRLAVVPVPPALTSARLYGADVAGVYVDAMAVRFDAAAWEGEFSQLWPSGSPAEISYRRRIVEGPAFTIDDALGREPLRACT
ncbi:MAG: hypothetical protein ABJA83_02950 [Burkholderiaceae bacterium]